jgi:Fur family ferric uptake transcriptional regulator
VTASESVQLLERRLARGGLRSTAPRRALLDAMLALGDHFTAEELAAAAPGVGRATVFRTLRLLQDLGSICLVVLDDGTSEYRLAEAGHHHHLVCSSCGRVSDISGCDLTGLLRTISDDTGFEVEAHRLELYGRCAECRAGRQQPDS